MLSNNIYVSSFYILTTIFRLFFLLITLRFIPHMLPNIHLQPTTPNALLYSTPPSLCLRHCAATSRTTRTRPDARRPYLAAYPVSLLQDVYFWRVKFVIVGLLHTSETEMRACKTRARNAICSFEIGMCAHACAPRLRENFLAV